MPLETLKSEAQSIGDYDLLEKIAEGGMGTVYRGRHRESGLQVAVKILPPHLAKNPVYLKRFEQEYQAAKTLDHPNIVKALHFSPYGERPYMVMEFVEGESLGQRLERVQRLGEVEAVRIIAQVSQGLHKAHKLGLIHRDVKPDNIILTPDGQAKLIDLGLVKEMDTDLNLTRTNRGLGTPHFMSPEQFRNAKNADIRCDIYSMAATLYMMVTGELPFKALNPIDAWMKKINNEIAAPRKLAPHLTERVDWAIRRSMSADPTQRASSCREFIEDLTGHSTRKVTAPITEVDVWYMMYKDEEEVLHTVKGATNAIRHSLKHGLLGDASQIRVSRSKGGPFDPLRQHPEFRDLVVEPAKMPGPSKERSQTAASEASAVTPTNFSVQHDTVVTKPVKPVSHAGADSTSILLPPGFTVPPKPAAVSAAAKPADAPVPAGPKIDIAPIESVSDFVKWMALFFVAMAVGLMGYFLLPVLSRLGVI